VLSAAYRKSYGRHYLPRVDSYEALVALGMEVLSTSANGIEDVKLAIGPDGALAWDVPSGPQFYWTKEGGVWRGVEW